MASAVTGPHTLLLWVLAFWEDRRREGGDRHKAGFDPPAPAQWAAMMSSLSAVGAHQPDRCLACRGSICIWALLASVRSVRSGPNIDKTSLFSTCVRKRSTVHITNCMIVESSRIGIQLVAWGQTRDASPTFFYWINLKFDKIN